MIFSAEEVCRSLGPRWAAHRAAWPRRVLHRTQGTRRPLVRALGSAPRPRTRQLLRPAHRTARTRSSCRRLRTRGGRGMCVRRSPRAPSAGRPALCPRPKGRADAREALSPAQQPTAGTYPDRRTSTGTVSVQDPSSGTGRWSTVPNTRPPMDPPTRTAGSPRVSGRQVDARVTRFLPMARQPS